MWPMLEWLMASFESYTNTLFCFGLMWCDCHPLCANRPRKIVDSLFFWTTNNHSSFIERSSDVYFCPLTPESRNKSSQLKPFCLETLFQLHSQNAFKPSATKILIMCVHVGNLKIRTYAHESARSKTLVCNRMRYLAASSSSYNLDRRWVCLAYLWCL